MKNSIPNATSMVQLDDTNSKLHLPPGTNPGASGTDADSTISTGQSTESSPWPAPTKRIWIPNLTERRKLLKQPKGLADAADPELVSTAICPQPSSDNSDIPPATNPEAQVSSTSPKNVTDEFEPPQLFAISEDPAELEASNSHDQTGYYDSDSTIDLPRHATPPVYSAHEALQLAIAIDSIATSLYQIQNERAKAFCGLEAPPSACPAAVKQPSRTLKRTCPAAVKQPSRTLKRKLESDSNAVNSEDVPTRETLPPKRPRRTAKGAARQPSTSSIQDDKVEVFYELDAPPCLAIISQLSRGSRSQSLKRKFSEKAVERTSSRRRQ